MAILMQQLSWVACAPFAALLCAIAVLPLAAPRWWDDNLHRALVAALFGLPVAIGVGVLDRAQLWSTGGEYIAFICLLGALYTISGGIVVRGTLAGTPTVNTAMLGAGALLASLIGTTGASMVLIRPLLRANHKREHRALVVVFFIFVVCNVGGLLTPLGDPPLFLGYLRGVPFFWTLRLWPAWTGVNGALLLIFLLLDRRHFRAEIASARRGGVPPCSDEERQPLSVGGSINLFFLTAIVVLLLTAGKLQLEPWARDLGMIALAGLSYALTPRAIHREHAFAWAPIIEVAVVFAGIFATMIPALALLRAQGVQLGLHAPWQFFWATGLLSSFLDNTPTYLTFVTAASSLTGTDSMQLQALIAAPGGNGLLLAISLGAVLMGANTYVGNGPNFMVKALAEKAGVKMPSFFHYMVYSGAILLPLFVLVTWILLP